MEELCLIWGKSTQFESLKYPEPFLPENISLIKEFDDVKFSMCDTIDFWINTKRASVVRMFKEVDAVVINDEEAKLLTKEFNLIKCKKWWWCITRALAWVTFAYFNS